MQNQLESHNENKFQQQFSTSTKHSNGETSEVAIFGYKLSLSRD